jgi:hypothetical protein
MFFITTKHILLDICPTSDGRPLRITIARLWQPRLDVCASTQTPEGSSPTLVGFNPAKGFDFTIQ